MSEITYEMLRRVADELIKNRAKPIIVDGAPVFYFSHIGPKGALFKTIGLKYRLPLRRRKMRK